MDLLISAISQRSGSTMLQRIFNARKQTMIWGENHGDMNHFVSLYEVTRHFAVGSEPQRSAYFSNQEDPNQWIAIMTPEESYVDKAITEAVKGFHKGLYIEASGGHDKVGYKEVRYGRKEVELFRRTYPHAEIFLLVRNPIDIWQSMPQGEVWTSFETLINIWNERATQYVQLANDYSNVHLVRYEDVVNRESETLGLIARHGDLTIEQIEGVLSEKIASTRREIPQKERMMIMIMCKEGMELLGYLPPNSLW